MKKILDILTPLVQERFEKLGYEKDYGLVTISNRPDLCQFQCNGALPAAKKYKKAPIQIATEVLEELKSIELIENLSTAGPGFINFNITDSFLAQYANDMYKDCKYGCEIAENPLTIVVDYGGANVAKPLHVGHLRAAIIGESLRRIFKFLGHNVIGDVHLGDWGLQIGMVISELARRKPNLPYFDKDFNGVYPTEAPFTIDELEDIYPAASKLAKSDENAMLAAREATADLQNGRPGYMALWKHILRVSVADLKKNYGKLNVEFDLWKGESDSQKYICDIVEYMKNNNYAYESEGAIVIDVSKEDDTQPIPPFILLKSDGSSLYSTTDLATIYERVKDFDPNEIVYVVDKRQGLHFEQVFRCAKKTGIAPTKLSFDFIGFGTMNGKDGKPFKTRDGGVMRLQDLIEIIKNNVLDKLKDNKALEGEDINEIARMVGISALKYGDLSNQATKDYVFDMDRFASFEGNTGPYILYTVVRIKSILRKVENEQINISKVIASPASTTERELMLKLARFNEAIETSFEDKAPHRICDYIYETSNLLNKFYHENKIISEEDLNKKMSWINLITLTKGVIETGLDLLGIEAPDKM